MLNQRLQLKLQQKLSPQQIQAMKLLQVPTAALEQRIKEELEANPALEDETGDKYEDDLYDASAQDDSNDAESDELAGVD